MGFWLEDKLLGGTCSLSSFIYVNIYDKLQREIGVILLTSDSFP